MREVFKRNVYEKVDIQECWENTGKEEMTRREEERNANDRKRSQEEMKGRDDRMCEGIGYRNNDRKRGMQLEFIDVRRA